MTIREMMAMYHSLQFVEELLDYIEQYPDDDYMTMECLCRKLVKYHLMSKVDGYYQTHEIRTNTHECVEDTHDKTEPQKRCDECIHFDKPYKKRDKDGMLIIGVECDGMDEPCDKWTDKPQTDCAWK